MSFMVEEDGIQHYGILRKSGRYPWGSGETPYERSNSFQSYVKEMRNAGLSNAQIAEGIGADFSTAALRATASLAKQTTLAENEGRARRLKDHGVSDAEAARLMGVNESTYRGYLARSQKVREDKTKAAADFLREEADKKTYLDISSGNEATMKISRERLRTAVEVLKSEGYEVHQIKTEQVGRPGNYTTILVLTPPGITKDQVNRNRAEIKTIMGNTDDFGATYPRPPQPVHISSSRVAVRYKNEGGADMDGVVQLRPGVADLSLGTKRYAQVRIAVDGTHYIKGMAIYANDLPKGIDIRVNVDKSPTGNKLDALKKLETKNPDYPFGSIVRIKTYIDKDGKTKQSALNTVGSKPGAGEEGGWDWRKRLSSQVLSKQPTDLAKQQLGLAYDKYKNELNTRQALTNPAVKKKLLNSLADKIDSDAVDLAAAALPRQNNKVILPIKSLKDNEVYAPGYKQGETVVLIRHPHAGTFEIPELRVNKLNKEGKSIIGDAEDAIGINPKVAKRLSGADFDGDTVIIIPNGTKKIKTTQALKDLETFDPHESFKLPAGGKVIKETYQQQQMGIVSNLITDMTIKGAPPQEIARAVKHSMVIIDAKKHELDYKRSAEVHGIAALKAKYQKDPVTGTGGAATIVSRAKSPTSINEQRLARKAEGGPIDVKTGAKRLVDSGNTRTIAYKDKVTGELVRKKVPVKTASTKMADTKDANTLVSHDKKPIELVYATHANNMKALANQARLAAYNTPNQVRNPSAAKVYAKEVASLNASLNLVNMNKPLERRAQVIANATISQIRRANPNLPKKEVKKLEQQAILSARFRTGAQHTTITISPKEWEAIQAGAISHTKLTQILAKTDDAEIQKYATPKEAPTMTAAKLSRAKMMASRGYTMDEIAEHLGVSLSMITKTLNS